VPGPSGGDADEECTSYGGGGQEGGVPAWTVGGRDADPDAAQKSAHGCVHWAACGACPGTDTTLLTTYYR